MTFAERKLWRFLRQIRFSGSHFRRQATVGPYIVHFASHSRRIVIELDGGQHAEAGQMKRDAERDDYFRRGGYRVFRFWNNNDVTANADGVAAVIAAAIENASPPTPAAASRGEGSLGASC